MKQLQRISYLWLGFVVGILCFVGVGGPGEARTLHVANNGSDSFTCGDKDHSCRSISQAIINASAGDLIIVGPGRYGDLNGNGIFGELGEEVAQIGFGCRCMIRLNKRVTLTSRDGASTTVLDGGGVASVPVQITASGVVFGQPGRGFLITGGKGNGLSCCSGAINVKVAGNIATGNGGDGFFINGNNSQVSNNLAIGNGNIGFMTGGQGQVWRQNIASGNVHGLGIIGNGHRLRENNSNGNSVDGVFVFDGAGQIQLLDNAFLGNGDAGIRLLPGATVTIRRNNIYGNNGCGLVNESGLKTIANNNFWGTSSGPGPTPANEVCDFGNSSTVFVPFATTEFASSVQPFSIQSQSAGQEMD